MMYIASDHAGRDLKDFILTKFSLTDLGTTESHSVDYPTYAKKMVNLIKEGDLGILICGSGIGMSIAANRSPKIRAALCHNAEYAKLARQHNDANILVLGARYISQDEAIEIINIFLSTEFLGGRHSARVEQLSDF